MEVEAVDDLPSSLPFSEPDICHPDVRCRKAPKEGVKGRIAEIDQAVEVEAVDDGVISRIVLPEGTERR
jgi:hypothetical protein